MRVPSFACHLFLVSALVLAGCRTVSELGPVTDGSFFPPPPNPARVQYLRNLTRASDVLPRNSLMDFIAGPGDFSDYALAKPFSVATWKGRVYVTDSYGARGLNVFDLGNRDYYILGKKPGQGLLLKPMHVFVDENGFKYVSDIVRRRVVVFGPDDNYVRSYGDGVAFMPLSCVVYGDEVYVLDVQKKGVTVERNGNKVDREIRRDQVLVLDKATGKPKRRIGRHGVGGFAYAAFLGVDREGSLYVSDFLHHRIVKMDGDGNVYLEFGTHGNLPGAFPKPKAVAVDRQGLIYVADAELHIVQVFDNAGQLLFYFGEFSAEKGRLDLPAGVWIDYDNVEYFREYYGADFEPEYLIFVANQLADPPGIGVYAYGKRRSHEYPPDDNVVTLDKAAMVPVARLPVFPPDKDLLSTAAPENADDGEASRAK